jgi:hypothetical protein
MAGVIVKHTRFAARTTNGDQTITFGMTDTPKAVMFNWSYATADATATDGLVRGFGITDGSVDGALVSWDEHGAGTSVVGSNNDADICINLRDDSGAALASAVWKSFGAGECVITWTVTTGTAILIEAVAFAGDDLSASVEATGLTNLIDTAHDITTVGFEPDLVIAMTRGEGFGFVHNDRASTIVQRAALHRGRNGRATSENYSKFYTDCGCLVGAGAFASDANCKLEFSGFDGDGFTVTTRQNAPGSGVVLLTLALRLTTASKVYTYDTPTSTGNATDTGAGFKPQFVMYLGTLMEAVDTYYDNALAGSACISANNTSGQNCTAWSSEDAVATMNTQSLIDDQSVNLPLHDGATGLTASFVEFASTGITLNWSAVQTNAKKWVALVIEEEAPPAGAIEGASAGAATAVGALINATPATSQYARPNADISLGGWTDENDGTTNIYQSIDEVTPSDLDYIKSSVNPTSDAVVIGLESKPAPIVDTGHVLRYRYRKEGSGTVNINVALMEGSSVIASWQHDDIGTITTAEQTLTELQAGSITDYSSLRFRVTASEP